MTPQQFVGLWVRLFAAWLALTALWQFTFAPELIALPNKTGAFVVFTIVMAIYLVVAALLWMFPLAVANRLVPRTRHEDRLTFQGHELARVGCAVFGLWLFAQSMPALIRFLIITISLAGPASAYSSSSSQYRTELAVQFVEALFAVLLIVKARVFARIVMGEPSGQDADAESDRASPQADRPLENG